MDLCSAEPSLTHLSTVAIDVKIRLYATMRGCHLVYPSFGIVSSDPPDFGCADEVLPIKAGIAIRAAS